MDIRFFQVDAFTHTPFSGNPAGVCLLETPLPDETLRAIAAENNLSETAFLLKQADGYSLRWFTPEVEVPLCGHATLASAHVLWSNGLEPREAVLRFHTVRSGLLTAAGNGQHIELNFPARPYEPVVLPTLLRQLFQDRESSAVYSHDRYIIELPSAAAVIDFKPDFQLLAPYQVVITARDDREGSPYDIVSRYFAVPLGVNEDPVTGSAHCCLAPYWAGKLGKTSLNAYQASARSGAMQVELQDDRVLLRGEAVTVISGIFTINH
ncbi:PhzF family phenazine biosynthesis protein [Chitinophaga qingshengii]|uniref:PhzF family phenazine biosynthesis isomerase n=1 Tax=Chitinophaga qingshengii TaxID=1569794 RepID=A0ABR7TGJ1_9BACT|nr:PhzF family phenazine biosynthesis isomerase [Chitinophaga qingshengii]MBC9929055.1 PhzF family phenazine biosynthesis isomerase [Chitinophaga qingshengii]